MKTQGIGLRQRPHRVSRLVVAARAADETFGCGGILAKYREDSAVVVLGEMEEARARRFQRAKDALGYQQSFAFDLPAGRVGDEMYRLTTMLAELLVMTRPVELYVPFPSVDHDQAAAFEGSMRLARATAGPDRWIPPSVLMYGVDAGQMSSYSADVSWRVCEPLEESHLDSKIAAALAYHPEPDSVPELTHAIRNYAVDAGNAGHVPFGEQFAVVRSSRVVDAGSSAARPHARTGARAMAGSTS